MIDGDDKNDDDSKYKDVVFVIFVVVFVELLSIPLRIKLANMN